MMPVAGQDAIVDGAFVQGETHMRAAVIDGVHLAVVLEKRYDMMPGQHGQAALGLQFGQAGHAYPLACHGLELVYLWSGTYHASFPDTRSSFSKGKYLEKHTLYDRPCKDVLCGKVSKSPHQTGQLPL